jgi:hypothetical protein
MFVMQLTSVLYKDYMDCWIHVDADDEILFW